MPTKVMIMGLGPIGAGVARQLLSRSNFRVVAAVDIDPAKVGKDLGELVGLAKKTGVKLTADVSAAIRKAKPQVAVLCTSSSLKKLWPQLESVLKLKLPIVSTTEELSYPWLSNRALARRIDAAAKKAKVAVVGTGVNPGFAMDALPITLTAICERVDAVRVERIQDARIRRLPFQQKIGAGPDAGAVRRQGEGPERAPRRPHRVGGDDRGGAGLEARARHRRDPAEDRCGARREPVPEGGGGPRVRHRAGRHRLRGRRAANRAAHGGLPGRPADLRPRA